MSKKLRYKQKKNGRNPNKYRSPASKILKHWNYMKFLKTFSNRKLPHTQKKRNQERSNQPFIVGNYVKFVRFIFGQYSSKIYCLMFDYWTTKKKLQGKKSKNLFFLATSHVHYTSHTAQSTHHHTAKVKTGRTIY